MRCGLEVLDSAVRTVAVHDGARPCVSSDTVSEVIRLAKRTGPVAIGRKMIDTVKLCEKPPAVSKTVDRAKLWSVQTPQAFPAATLKKAYAALEGKKTTVTDDAQAVELIGESVKIYESNKPNIKITTVEDLLLASAIVIK